MKPETPSMTSDCFMIGDSAFQEQCRSLLAEAGFRVKEFTSAADALKQLQHDIPQLIISQIWLDPLNGLQLCRLLKHDAATEHVPVLLVGNPHDSRLERFWSYKTGADGYLLPHQLDSELIEQAQNLLDLYGIDESHPLEGLGNKADHPMIPADEAYIRLSQILDKSLIESTLMAEFRNLSDLTHNRPVLDHMVFNLLESVVPYDLAAVYFHENNRDTRHVAFHQPSESWFSTAPDSEKPAFWESLTQEFFDAVCKEADLSDDARFQKLAYTRIGEETMAPATHPAHQYQDEVLLNQGSSSKAGSPDPHGIDFHQALWLHHWDGEQYLGATCFFNQNPSVLESSFPLALIEEEMTQLMRHRGLVVQTQVAATTDMLTGLMNYRTFQQVLAHEWRRCKRYDQPLALALVHVEALQQINASYGLETGDAILKTIAKSVEALIRTVDIPARFSGGTIAILFPETTIESAQIPCQRLSEVLREKLEGILPEESSLLGSSLLAIGLTGLHEGDGSEAALIQRCETGIANIPLNGGNPVMIISPSPTAS